MPEIMRWILAALAAWRLAQFITLDDGPWDVMFLLRRRMGRYTLGPSPEDAGYYQPVTGLGRMLECIHCVGKWTALAVMVLALWPTLPGDFLLAWWGLAGAQSLIEGRRNAQMPAHPVRMRVVAGDEDV